MKLKPPQPEKGETIYTATFSEPEYEFNLDRDELIAQGPEGRAIAEMFWPGWIGEALDSVKKDA